MWSILTITFLLFALANAERDCLRIDGALVCDRERLQNDNPLQLNSSATFLVLERASGSIDSKTFSLMPKLEKLTIKKSTISSLQDGVLCLPKLTELNIQDNTEFPVLTKTLLRNCKSIEKVSLTATAIEPNALEDMASLKSLRLSQQIIPQLEPLTNLEELNILDCITVGDDAPNGICSSPKLEKLTIQVSDTGYPPLKTSTFKRCNNLKRLKISGGKNHSNWEEHIFNGLSSVKFAAIAFGNRVHLTKNHLAGLNGVEILDLYKARITQIDADTFDGFDQLKKLALELNLLTEFDANILTSLPNLEYLNLAENFLSTIDNLSHPKLEVITIRCNRIHKLNATRIKENLPKLKNLFVACTPLQLEKSDREEFGDILGYLEYPNFRVNRCPCRSYSRLYLYR